MMKKISQLEQDSCNQEPKIMLFDLRTTGHHAGYIQHLINYWCKQKLSGSLNIVTIPQFLEQHPDIVELFGTQDNINFVTTTIKEQENLSPTNSSFAGRLRRSFQEWYLIRKYAKSLKSNHCVLMWFDSVFSRMSLGVNPPCPMSGVFFRPILHYSNFDNYLASPKERLWQWREKLGLSRILKDGYFANLFCLDPVAVEYIQNLPSQTNIVHLPDPVQIYNESKSKIDELKKSLNIDSNRQVFLLFGSISERKGIFQLLDAINSISPQLCEKLCLLIVGPIDPLKKEDMKARITSISQSLPVQIICLDKFITDQEIQPYFQISDVILTPYQRHVGMSAIIVRAAAVQKPVLCSDYGLMGEVTRRYNLGLTVNSSDPTKIAEGITRFLTKDLTEWCDRQKMEQFVQENTAEKFAKTIFDNVLLFQAKV